MRRYRSDMDLPGPGDFNPPEPAEPPMMKCPGCNGKGTRVSGRGEVEDILLDVAADFRRNKDTICSDHFEATVQRLADGCNNPAVLATIAANLRFNACMLKSLARFGHDERADKLNIAAAILEKPMEPATCVECMGTGEIEDTRDLEGSLYDTREEREL